jgi:hypothetical protein
MTVSVVIPTYNSATLVTQAIDSALAQSAAPAEILVVDDGSTDDTRERLAAYGPRITYLLQENQGVAAARNLGLSRARGQYVAFLDADDVWHPQKLELQLVVFDNNSELALLGTGRTWPLDLTLPRRGPIRPIAWRDLAVKNHFVASSVLVRREALDRAGGFDRSLHGPEDYDLWLRIAQTAAVANLELPLTGYRTSPGSLSQQVRTMRQGMRRILAKLDAANAWGGDAWLRRKAYGYCGYSCAIMSRAAGLHLQAMADLARSIASYPFPYRSSEIAFPLARLRMWPIIVARLLGIGRG